MEWNITCTQGKPFQFVDAFRQIFPTRKLAYTCWNSEKNCRSTNYGTRIDYIFIDIELYQTGILKHCDIKPDVLGSDHCPVVADIDLQVSLPPKCPSYCTKNFPEFIGTQQKISKFLKTNSDCDGSSNLKRQKLVDNFQDKSICKEHGSKSINKVIGKNNFRTNSTKSNQTNITCYFGAKGNSTKKFNSTGLKETTESTAILKDDDSSNNQLSMQLLDEHISKRQQSSEAWKTLMSSKLKTNVSVPVCKGHKEPCALRTVKRPGKNQGRKFFACVRGVGRADDPNAQCGFFEWSE